MDLKNRAFTLIETLVAIVILALVILNVILAFAIDNYATKMSKHRMIVINLVRSELEKALAANYGALSSVSETVYVNEGSGSLAVQKDVKVQDMKQEQDAFGYKKIYVKFVWLERIFSNKTLKEEAVLYVAEH